MRRYFVISNEYVDFEKVKEILKENDICYDVYNICEYFSWELLQNICEREFSRREIEKIQYEWLKGKITFVSLDELFNSIKKEEINKVLIQDDLFDVAKNGKKDKDNIFPEYIVIDATNEEIAEIQDILILYHIDYEEAIICEAFSKDTIIHYLKINNKEMNEEEINENAIKMILFWLYSMYNDFWIREQIENILKRRNN